MVIAKGFFLYNNQFSPFESTPSIANVCSGESQHTLHATPLTLVCYVTVVCLSNLQS